MLKRRLFCLGVSFVAVICTILLLILPTSETAIGQDREGQKTQKPPSDKKKVSEHFPAVPPPSASAAYVAKGYRVQVILNNLTYPSSVELDTVGNLYVAEAGYSYGDPKAKPRIKQRRRGGAFETVISEGLEGPVTDLLWYQGRLFISHRGKISAWRPGGRLTDLVTDLPSLGDHHNNQMAVGPDGMIYFGQGTATNSGVVGKDNYKMGWLKKHPEFHDVPARNITLTDEQFKSPNPLSQKQGQVITSPFHPFGKNIQSSAVVQGQTKANGTILRMSPDGTNLEVYAWGFRNPYGVAWSPDGKLYASENGFDVRGSRPIANDKEDIYLIKRNAWYGWPDYAMGLPITDARFKPKDGPSPHFLMKRHPPVEKPLFTFPKHAAITQMDFCRNQNFGFEGQMFVAFFGHLTPMTGKAPEKHGGHQVLRIDLRNGKTEKFFGRKEHSHHGTTTYAEELKKKVKKEGDRKSKEEHHHSTGGKKDQGHHKEGGATPGPRRLMDVRFSPTGDALFVVDFGAVFVTEDGRPSPVPGTGVVWQITRDDLPIITP